jgi:TolA-binding protein
MTELSPLLCSSLDEFELGLLRSAECDEPSASALSKTALAVGLGTGAMTLAAGAGASTAGGAVASSATASSLWISALKALAVGATSGVIVSTSAHAVFSKPASEAQSLHAPAPTVDSASRAQQTTPPRRIMEDERHAPTRHDSPESVAPYNPTSRAASVSRGVRSTNGTAGDHARRRLGLEASQGRGTSESVSGAEAGHSVAAAALPSATAAPTTERAPQGVSIAEEVRTIDRARRALAAGRAREALRELEHYQARWPNGALSAEALVLRVEAKLKLGDRPAAEREARALINAHPNSRHADRLRALLGLSAAQ